MLRILFFAYAPTSLCIFTLFSAKTSPLKVLWLESIVVQEIMREFLYLRKILFFLMTTIPLFILEKIPLLFFADGHRTIYAEPKDVQETRMKASLPALTEYVLDESVPIYERYSWYAHPFFMATDKNDEGAFGREVWIKDLAHFQYKPAYPAIREVWLHDNDKYLPNSAFHALADFHDARLLVDVKNEFNNYMQNWSTISSYDQVLGQLDFPESVALMLDVADTLRTFNDGVSYTLHNGELSNEKSIFSRYPASDIVLDMMTSLGTMKNDKVELALRVLKDWFPDDLYLARRYSQSKELHKNIVISSSSPEMFSYAPLGLYAFSNSEDEIEF